jgi:agmatine deiminase
MTVRIPPEWAPQDWLWIGFPHNPVEWPGTLERAQEQIAAFANAVVEAGQSVRLVVRNRANAQAARALVSDRVKLITHEYGDIWLRDTGPIVVERGKTRLAKRFAFNGWGDKYRMPGDETVGASLAHEVGLPVETHDWILEGGALDTDGTGLAVTTEQCLLNPNRNPGLSREDIELRLGRHLGISRVLWLGEGMVNDHTDGHVDNLARFVGPGELALPLASGADDPNAHIYADARERARRFGVSVHDIPSPGLVEVDGEIVPASYMNFAVTGPLVVVPTYGVAHDDDAVAAVGAFFPDKACIGLPADGVLSGGGSFHCASMQAPSPRP